MELWKAAAPCSTMRIDLITPTAKSRKGNWITAARWARMLRGLGHQVRIEERWSGRPCDLLVALHAGKSFSSIKRFHEEIHGQPLIGQASDIKPKLIVVLTGTDLYGHTGDGDSGGADDEVWQALDWADRVIVLQPLALRPLPPAVRCKTRVILQSAVATRSQVAKSLRTFDVCVVGHLRPVKDPFRAAEAARRLPTSSRIRIVHAGRALEPAMEAQAHREMAENDRYIWLGERPRWQILRLLKRCHVMAHTSINEGGASAMSEAVVAGLPIVSSRMDGAVGLLGAEHPGYFEVGDTAGLARLLERCETDPDFLDRLAECSRRLAPRFAPDVEIDAWRTLIDEIFVSEQLPPAGSTPGLTPGPAAGL